MLNLPQTTEVNKNIPKSKFYEKSDISAGLKESFVNELEKIIWANKLSPKTLNIAAGSSIKEIEIFLLKLKTPQFNPKILEAIDRAVPYYILYVLEYQGKYQLWLGYKEKSVNPDKKTTVARYFNSDWSAEPAITVNGNKLDSVYQGFLEQLSSNRISADSGRDIKEQVNLTTRIDGLQKQISRLTAKMNAEKQFNRQLELKRQIKQLQQQIKDLNNG